MARDTKDRTVYRCVEPFAIFKDGRPEVYGEGVEVLDGDPILKTHRTHFEDSVSRVLRSRNVEQATAAPGERRTVTTIPQTTEGAHSGDEEGK